MMSNLVYYISAFVIVLAILIGISLMSQVKTAVKGNQLSALGVTAGIVVTLLYYNILDQTTLWIFLAIGLVLGVIWSMRIKMIQMPQVVALLNGFGGAASALVAAISILDGYSMNTIGLLAGGLALAIGALTLTGSLVAAGKLHKVLDQKPVTLKHHQIITKLVIVAILATIVMVTFNLTSLLLAVILCTVLSAFFGIIFAIRVGGADMPITISLLNSLSGVAGAIAGIAIGDPLLVAIGGVVGASGLLLTQIMCKSMNRSLGDILTGKTSAQPKSKEVSENIVAEKEKSEPTQDYTDVLKNAKKVIIVPGYGMALAQAQGLVKELKDTLESRGAEVLFAIHPVAGRMPGHMNVLLCEVDIPYEQLLEMDDVNDQFKDCDVAIVVGANDVINPAARNAEGTPIYGMPILSVDEAPCTIICNFDTLPGYAGVENPLYKDTEKVVLLEGDAKDSLNSLLASLNSEKEAVSADSQGEVDYKEKLVGAKKVIIVPGYGMALAQAQGLVKQLSDKLENAGVEVMFAIHPVAGRMPGHMNVLLCEVDIPYERLLEMDDVNPHFKDCDVAIVIGANDVINPAARDAVGTPIYGMPILSVDEASEVIICNFDLSPGYAGVENPLYSKATGVTLLLGDAGETLKKLI